MPAQLRTLIHRLVLSAPTLQKAPLCAIRALQGCSAPVLTLSSLTVAPLDFIRLSRTRSLATHVQLVLPVLTLHSTQWLALKATTVMLTLLHAFNALLATTALQSHQSRSFVLLENGP